MEPLLSSSGNTAYSRAAVLGAIKSQPAGLTMGELAMVFGFTSSKDRGRLSIALAELAKAGRLTRAGRRQVPGFPKHLTVFVSAEGSECQPAPVVGHEAPAVVEPEPLTIVESEEEDTPICGRCRRPITRDEAWEMLLDGRLVQACDEEGEE